MPALTQQKDQLMPEHETTPDQSADPHANGANLQRIVVAYGMAIFTMVIGTALWAPAENSERAFRLLHWWKRAPEPAPEDPTPPDQRRAERAKR
ncbi:hypothetical protein ABZ299_11580 [Streptomyces sp. NPDC006184]|uniref:hypothetical protein n=1 Tax=Streptomyces sp. NPDC006184 TaxID=3155455 RepID=UPI0033B0B354